MNRESLEAATKLADSDFPRNRVSEAVERRSMPIANTIALVASIINFWAKHELKRRDDLPLTESQAAVLYHVRLGITTSSEIAKALAVTRRAITTTVDQLVESGLIVRSDDAVDRRIVRLSITDEGRLLSLRLEEELLDELVFLLDELSEDERRSLEQGVNILLPITLRLSPQFPFRR